MIEMSEKGVRKWFVLVLLVFWGGGGLKGEDPAALSCAFQVVHERVGETICTRILKREKGKPGQVLLTRFVRSREQELSASTIRYLGISAGKEVGGYLGLVFQTTMGQRYEVFACRGNGPDSWVFLDGLGVTPPPMGMLPRGRTWKLDGLALEQPLSLLVSCRACFFDGQRLHPRKRWRRQRYIFDPQQGRICVGRAVSARRPDGRIKP